MTALADDGSMKKDHREESLAKIRTDKKTKVILISFKAGSTGLNLTCCNNVILVDMWWNPALEVRVQYYSPLRWQVLTNKSGPSVRSSA